MGIDRPGGVGSLAAVVGGMLPGTTDLGPQPQKQFRENVDPTPARTVLNRQRNDADIERPAA